MVRDLKHIILLLSSFLIVANGHFQRRSRQSVWIRDKIVVTGRRLVSSKSSKSSPTGNNRQREHKSGYMYDEKKSKFLTVDSRKSNDGSSDGRSSNRKGESRSEASRKGTGDSDDSDKSKSKRDDSSRNVARSPSISASRPQSNTKQQSRSSNNHRHKSRSSDTKWSNDTDESKRKKTKKSQSDPGGIFTPRGSTSAVNTPSPTPEDSLFAPTLEPEMTCDAKMRKCGRERRPIYALDLEDYIN